MIKQADLVLAMLWYSDRFSAEDKARNVDYYERRTVRDSSLSACIQAVLAAEVGHLELAHDYTYEAALIDLQDLHNNTGDGLHIASLAGAWIALVSGFGGLRVCSGELVLDPALPAGINRLCFGLRWQGMRLTVEVRPDQVTYSLRDGAHASTAAPARRRAADRLRGRTSHPQPHPSQAPAPAPGAASRPDSPASRRSSRQDPRNLIARGRPAVEERRQLGVEPSPDPFRRLPGDVALGGQVGGEPRPGHRHLVRPPVGPLRHEPPGRREVGGERPPRRRREPAQVRPALPVQERRIRQGRVAVLVQQQRAAGPQDPGRLGSEPLLVEPVHA